MTPLLRWCKFNLVGAMGAVLQLGLLALLNRLAPGHYLAATAVAIELTLLHNFAWHVQFTWGDRRDESPLFMQMLQFQLSNGLVSLAGNLLLMRVLVQQARLPLLLSNAIAILVCSIVNFKAGDRWAFREKRRG